MELENRKAINNCIDTRNLVVVDLGYVSYEVWKATELVQTSIIKNKSNLKEFLVSSLQREINFTEFGHDIET